jgi:hypothetical protein
LRLVVVDLDAFLDGPQDGGGRLPVGPVKGHRPRLVAQDGEALDEAMEVGSIREAGAAHPDVLLEA